MIAEYHMACVTRGSPVTSPILPKEIDDQLPPLPDYTCPGDNSGLTDVRVWDHRAKSLRVAVWLHRLDMALSGEPTASGSLVQARHNRGRLLGHLLVPGTANIRFKEVVNQVL